MNTGIFKWEEIGISKGMDYYLYSYNDGNVTVFNAHIVREVFDPITRGGYFDYHAIEELLGVEFTLYRNGE